MSSKEPDSDNQGQGRKGPQRLDAQQSKQSEQTQSCQIAQDKKAQSNQYQKEDTQSVDLSDTWSISAESVDTLVPLLAVQRSRPPISKERGCKHVKPEPSKATKVHHNHPHLGAVGDALKDFGKQYENAYFSRKGLRPGMKRH